MGAQAIGENVAGVSAARIKLGIRVPATDAAEIKLDREAGTRFRRKCGDLDTKARRHEEARMMERLSECQWKSIIRFFLFLRAFVPSCQEHTPKARPIFSHRSNGSESLLSRLVTFGGTLCARRRENQGSFMVKRFHAELGRKNSRKNLPTKLDMPKIRAIIWVDGRSL